MVLSNYLDVHHSVEKPFVVVTDIRQVSGWRDYAEFKWEVTKNSEGKPWPNKLRVTCHFVDKVEAERLLRMLQGDNKIAFKNWL